MDTFLKTVSLIANIFTMDGFLKTVSLISNVFTIATSGIAIYLFLFKRETISSAFKVLLNYSSQITLSELRAKLERLNNLNTNEPTHIDEIVNIFNEIVGQIRGNKKLRKECSVILKKLSVYAEYPEKLTEPRKRNIVSELRENLRHINIESLDELIGG
jgi:hypothetical protein